MSFEHELEFARSAAQAAGENAVRLRRLGISTEVKPDGSLVTNADRENERILTELAERRFPDDGIVSEEGTRKQGTTSRRWIVDPIDGTHDFTRGNRFWCVLVALEADGKAVLGVAHFPMLGETYWAVRGRGAYRDGEPLRVSSLSDPAQAILAVNGLNGVFGEPYGARLSGFMSRFRAVRSYGGALDAVMLAAGKVDVWIERKAEVWDIAPLQVLIEEAGGRFSAIDGSKSINTGNALAYAPGLESDVRTFFGLTA